jgi:hypothetical protein
MYFNSKRVQLVTQATPDYSAGDLCGGKLTFPQRSTEGAGRLTRLVLKSLVSFSGIASKLYIFDEDPANTTFTENAGFSIHADDRSKLIEVVEIASGDWTDFTARSGLYIARKTLDVPFKLATLTKSIFAALVVENTLNLSGTADIEAILGGETD